MSQASLPDVPIADGYAPAQAQQQQPQPGKPHFTITGLNAPSTAQPGQSVNVSVTVKNDGQAAGSVTVRIINANGATVASQSATLQPGQSTTLSLSFAAPSQPGTYDYTVQAYNQATGSVDDSRSFSLTVQQQQQPAPQPQPAPSTTATTTSSGSGLLKWLAIAAIALLLLGYLGGERRQAY